KTDFGTASAFAARAYEAKGMREQALAQYQKAVETLGGAPLGLMIRARSEALAGRRSEALKTIEEMKKLASRRYVSPSYIATVYLDLKETEQAFEWLQKACSDHSWDLTFLKVEPMYDPIRNDPRFAALLRCVNLPTP